MSRLHSTPTRSDVVLLTTIAAVVLSVALATAFSRTPDLDARARALDAQLRCPTCQGLSIADSPATSASQMRALVREQLAAGGSNDDVRAFFVARYGRWILLDPPVGGVDLALWLAPAAIVATGAVLVVRRSRARASAPGRRHWSALSPLPASRLSAVLVGGAMLLALAVPIAAAVGPRLVGGEASGRAVAQADPTIEQLEAFVRAEPQDFNSLVLLGDALFAAGRGGEAADRYKAALALDPDNVQALLGVAALLLASDRPDAAGPVFDRVLSVWPDQPDALLYRAVARLQLDGKLGRQARGDLERFLAVTPSDDPRRVTAAGLLQASASAAPAGPPASAAPSRLGTSAP